MRGAPKAAQSARMERADYGLDIPQGHVVQIDFFDDEQDNHELESLSI
ncbi:hypothetical protein G3480_13615 [Thiorhodococcus mannitoliphagus]|uniref:Uncharacterized protein n=1 Tax=Thiorhodococcus mannitoliphagus TaxID=329406 RepID=A0A6P1DSR3_9GAMM|nr:hypothetical protein [Thiorhodococcus mannitoliphagus]NEX21337.1 hypothetical protein [Thiorhodococcus mannitoliphagus]